MREGEGENKGKCPISYRISRMVFSRIGTSAVLLLCSLLARDAMNLLMLSMDVSLNFTHVVELRVNTVTRVSWRAFS